MNGANYFYTRDHLGSIRELTDANGNLRARYDYDPYGQLTKVSGDLEADFAYTGHYRHQSSGLYLTLYRAYDPNLGRWLTRDPLGERGGINLYSYVLNNPINLYDPLGLDWMDSAIGVMPSWAVNGLANTPWSQGVSDFSAGLGDSLSMGATSWMRDGIGSNRVVNPCSGAYASGQWTGTGMSLAMGVAGGLRMAGSRGAGREFSHWIPNRMGGPRSPWNGNYVSSLRHYRHDPYRYPVGWRNMGPRYGSLTAQYDRIPNVVKGLVLGAGYGAAGQSMGNNQ